MKKSDQIKQSIKNARDKAALILNKEDATMEEIQAINKEIETLEAKLQLALKEEDLEAKGREGQPNNPNSNIEDKQDVTMSAEYKRAFLNMLKNRASFEDRIVIQNALSSNTDADGGVLIPKDQRTQIIEFKRKYESLRDLVTVETVSTLTGTRVVEVEAEYTPFAEITEGSQLSDIPSPQFALISYAIKTYGGILPIPNNLIADETANILTYLNKWFAKKEVATENHLITTLLNKASKTAITGLDDILTALNITLDPAISKNAIVVTNQTGFDFLDKLKDEKGNYLLQPNPLKPTEKLLKGREVKVYANKVLANDTTKAPIIIGNLKEAITLFDRQLMTLKSTDIGAGAFETNSTKTRGTLRLDVQQIDTKAFVFLQKDTADPEILKAKK